MTIEEEISALDAELQTYAKKTLESVKASKNKDNCNEVCQDCREEAERRFLSCVRHANSAEARQDCERVFREDWAYC